LIQAVLVNVDEVWDGEGKNHKRNIHSKHQFLEKTLYFIF